MFKLPQTQQKESAPDSRLTSSETVGHQRGCGRIIPAFPLVTGAAVSTPQHLSHTNLFPASKLASLPFSVRSISSLVAQVVRKLSGYTVSAPLVAELSSLVDWSVLYLEPFSYDLYTAPLERIFVESGCWDSFLLLSFDRFFRSGLIFGALPLSESKAIERVYTQVYLSVRGFLKEGSAASREKLSTLSLFLLLQAALVFVVCCVSTCVILVLG